jgi:hypothetical protein
MSDEIVIKTNVQTPGQAAPSPKRFIRTFESDAATLQKGGSPGFTSLEKKESEPETKKVDAKSIEVSEENTLRDSSIPERPIFESPTPGIIPNIPPLSRPSERLIESTTLPEPPPPPPELPKKEPPKAPKPIGAEPLHTYTDDFSTRIQSTKASTASILAAEQDAARPGFVVEKRGNLLFIIGGVLLLALGASGVYVAYLFMQKTAPVIIAPIESAAIFVNEREEITGMGKQLLQNIGSSAQKPLSENGVRLLYTHTATSTKKDVFHALELGVPNILSRNIEEENSMVGIVRVGGDQSPFFLLETASYTDTFAGMLSWEPRIAKDLAMLFPAHQAIVSASSTATSSPLVFHDEVIANHDVRILRDSAKRSIVVYGYWDPFILIIARNEGAFSELINRIATSKKER